MPVSTELMRPSGDNEPQFEQNLLEAEDEAKREPLTAKDRCDNPGCSAQALYRVILAENMCLIFCRHHYLHHENALLDVAKQIEDFTHLMQA